MLEHAITQVLLVKGVVMYLAKHRNPEDSGVSQLVSRFHLSQAIQYNVLPRTKGVATPITIGHSYSS